MKVQYGFEELKKLIKQDAEKCIPTKKVKEIKFVCDHKTHTVKAVVEVE